MINPEMVQLLYYMESKDSVEQKLAFPDMARFLHTHVASNPLFSSYLDEDMKKQIADLQSMLEVAPVKEEPASPVAPKETKKPVEPEKLEDTIIPVRETIAPLTVQQEPISINEDTLTVPQMDFNMIALVPFIERLNTTRTSAVTVEMRKLTDTLAIRLPMSVREMSVFIGSTPIQTQLVYGYAPGHTKKLSPLQYVHLLVDDLFKRPGLAGMISDEQRTLLSQRTYLMDLADKNASLTPSDLNILLRAFGVDDLTEDELIAIARPPKADAR